MISFGSYANPQKAWGAVFYSFCTAVEDFVLDDCAQNGCKPEGSVPNNALEFSLRRWKFSAKKEPSSPKDLTWGMLLFAIWKIETRSLFDHEECSFAVADMINDEWIVTAFGGFTYGDRPIPSDGVISGGTGNGPLAVS